MKNKYLWYTDTHFDLVAPWNLVRFLKFIKDQKPKGIFLTGDISNGIMTTTHLRMLASFIDCPIYFVLGNHDYHFKSIESQHEKIRALCQQYSNLIWLTESDIINLDHEVALIGAEGWYDAQMGNPKYLKATLDWVLTKDFRDLPTMDDRIEKFRQLAKQSTNLLEQKLEKALEQDYKTIYIMTHFPPWKEATRYEGSMLQEYHLPYNVNLQLGEMIERVMTPRKKRNVTVLAGHTHSPEYIRVSRNVNCQVGQAVLLNVRSQTIYT